MTNEQINIKVAELCGYRKLLNSDRVAINPRGDQVGWSELHQYVHCIPNYTSDLNACHEFEKAKLTTISLVTDYGIRLANIMHRDHNHHPRIADTGWKIPVVGNCSWCATARQRCEAFLRVHNQWEEEA